MNLGGMGTIGSLKKSSKIEKKNLRNQTDLISSKKISRKTQTQNSILEEVKQEMQGKESQRLLFANYPLAGWGIGIIMVISGLYLIYHISLGKYGSLFSEFREGFFNKFLVNYLIKIRRFWWQYMVSCLILLLGIMFLAFLKRESVVFNKNV